MLQEEQRRVNEESMNSQSTLADQQQESSTQPRNWNHKEVPQLPPVSIPGVYKVPPSLPFEKLTIFFMCFSICSKGDLNTCSQLSSV